MPLRSWSSSWSARAAAMLMLTIFLGIEFCGLQKKAGWGACVSGLLMVQDGMDAKTGRTHQCSVSLAPFLRHVLQSEWVLLRFAWCRNPVLKIEFCPLPWNNDDDDGRMTTTRQEGWVNGRPGHQSLRGGGKARQGLDDEKDRQGLKSTMTDTDTGKRGKETTLKDGFEARTHGGRGSGRLY